MIIAGLTGSIGMGKSTTAAMFRAEGAPVFDADATVHGLYAPGGRAVDAVERAFPGVTSAGGIDRARLAQALRAHADGFAELNRIVHPLVGAERRQFLVKHRTAAVVVLDIPLLFETGGARHVDAVIVVTAPVSVQRARVLARKGMTPALFEAIRDQQLSDAEKRRRADFLIETHKGFAAARRAVRRILLELKGWNRRRRPRLARNRF